MRLLLLRRLPRIAALLALLFPRPATAQDFVPPDLTRYNGVWLWVESAGLVVTSSPEMKGASRTLFLHPDLTYEFHQRTGTRDSTLCKGIFSVGESSERDAGDVVTTLDFDGWYEPYEKRMVVNFDGPDTLVMTGIPCISCPEHTFVRGQSALFTADVKGGGAYRRDLWDGLVFELRPRERGWEIAVADSARPGENRVEVTTSAAPGPDPRILEGSQLGEGRGKGTTRRFQFSRKPARRDSSSDEEDRAPAAGRGVLTVEDAKLSPAKAGKAAGIESMRFTVLIEEERRRGALAKSSP